MIRRPPRSTLFPYTTLFRSAHAIVIDAGGFDPQSLLPFSAELGALTVVSAPAPEIAGEAAATLARAGAGFRSEEHTSELQSQSNIVCRLLLEKTTIKLTNST